MVMGQRQLNITMDTLTDAIASNGGVFPEFDASVRPLTSGIIPYSDVITEETQFSIRFLRYGLTTRTGLQV